MGIGSYAGGLSRGIQNGVNISLALRADKRAEASSKLGIRRQEKLDSRSDTLFSQSQEDRGKKNKVDELNSRMNGYALKLASLGDINNVDSQTLTNIYQQEGMFDDLAKPNQTNFHIADYTDGKTKGKIIQFNQMNEDGSLAANEDGSPKWFSLTKNRGTTDEGVVMPAGYMVSNAFAKMVEQGADGKAALSLYDEKLTEREKLALQHKNKLDEQNNASSNKVKEKMLGVGVKPIIKSETTGKGKDKVTTFVEIIPNGKGGYAKREIKPMLTETEAYDAAKEEASKKASWFSGDQSDFGMSEDEWVKKRASEILTASDFSALWVGQ